MILNDFKNQLIKIINDSNLTIDAIYYVMKDIMNDIVTQYNLVLQQEAEAAASQKIESQEELDESSSSEDNIQEEE